MPFPTRIQVWLIGTIPFLYSMQSASWVVSFSQEDRDLAGINNVIVFVRHVLSCYLIISLHGNGNAIEPYAGGRLERHVMNKHASASYLDKIDDHLNYFIEK
jgi:hypothetical protein